MGEKDTCLRNGWPASWLGNDKKCWQANKMFLPKGERCVQFITWIAEMQLMSSRTALVLVCINRDQNDVCK